MRFVTCRDGQHICWGVMEDSEVLLPAPGRQVPRDLLAVIELGREAACRLARQLVASRGTRRRQVDAVELLAPIPRPRKNLLCLGFNYAEHAIESYRTKGAEPALPEHPVVFTKAVSAVTGPYSDVVLDPAVTRQMDWEVELAFLIGQRTRQVPEDQALDQVFGYMVVNDLSARDLPRRHQQFFIGKSLDNSCPMGPWLVTADEIPDPQCLELRCRVNGAEKQKGNTAQQIFGVRRIIHTLSRYMTLEAGDIVATGTSAGVGFARQPPEFLMPGDVVECEIAGLGILRNRIISPSRPMS